MATGFVQRWKGKVNAAQLWLAGTQIVASGSDINTLIGGSSLEALSTTSGYPNIKNNGMTTIASSSVLTTWRLATPAYAGQMKTINMITVSSGLFITTSTAIVTSLNGSSINNTMKSTQTGIISLEATSTTNWNITGLFGSSVSFLTISTTT